MIGGDFTIFGNYRLKLTQLKSHTRGLSFSQHLSLSINASVAVMGGRPLQGIDRLATLLGILREFRLQIFS